MRILFIIIILSFSICCNLQSSQQIQNKSVVNEDNKTSIYQIDFKNFAYSRTEDNSGLGETFTLVNGELAEHEEISFSLKSVLYEDNKAFVTIKIIDGNAGYHILFIYEIENNKPKLVQTFEFNETDNNLNSVSIIHGELVIETFIIGASDAQCCPSVIERNYYEWREDKFVLVSTQKISNDYLERRKNNSK